MNGYDLSRAWFEFSFNNPEKISPGHSAVYFFAIEHCNRLGWKDKFGFPSQMVMEAIGIKNWKTYSKFLNDLVEWGFIKMIETSKNQYSSNIIAIVKNTKATTKALDKALSKHSTKHSQSTVSIDKQYNNITINNKPTKNKFFEESSFEYKITKIFINKQLELGNTSFIYLYNKKGGDILIQKWADEIRKMKNIDKYSEKQIEFIIKYLFTNDFWKEQISSMEKLRKKNKTGIPYFIVLINEAKKDSKKQTSTSIGAGLKSYF